MKKRLNKVLNGTIIEYEPISNDAEGKNKENINTQYEEKIKKPKKQKSLYEKRMIGNYY